MRNECRISWIVEWKVSRNDIASRHPEPGKRGWARAIKAPAMPFGPESQLVDSLVLSDCLQFASASHRPAAEQRDPSNGQWQLTRRVTRGTHRDARGARAAARSTC